MILKEHETKHSYQPIPTFATSPPIKWHSPIGYWNLPAIMNAHFRFHTSTLCPSISTCKINVLNSFWMGGKEVSWGRCKCKWKPNCSSASELQTLQRTNVTHTFISYIFEMLKVQNHECHESWKIQGGPEKKFALKWYFAKPGACLHLHFKLSLLGHGSNEGEDKFCKISF